MSNDLEFAREWYLEGCSHDKEPVVRFMLLWIAFNWLYNSFQMYFEGKDPEANDLIHLFCEHYYDDYLRNYPAHETEAYQNLMGNSSQVKASDKKRGQSNSLNRRIHELRKHEVERLFRKIYRVRCFLFHGSKNLMDDDDMDLVRWSATIMQGYLETILG